jgi:hypothetical protein
MELLRVEYADVELTEPRLNIGFKRLPRRVPSNVARKRRDRVLRVFSAIVEIANQTRLSIPAQHVWRHISCRKCNVACLFAVIAVIGLLLADAGCRRTTMPAISARSAHHRIHLPDLRAAASATLSELLRSYDRAKARFRD